MLKKKKKKGEGRLLTLQKILLVGNIPEYPLVVPDNIQKDTVGKYNCKYY
eukprot:SAG11_NODE_883_length_6737_cov_10.576981_1_plen_50_part_00